MNIEIPITNKNLTIFFLKFWDTEDLVRAECIVKRAIHQERLRRNGSQ